MFPYLLGGYILPFSKKKFCMHFFGYTKRKLWFHTQKEHWHWILINGHFLRPCALGSCALSRFSIHHHLLPYRKYRRHSPIQRYRGWELDRRSEERRVGKEC